MAGFEEGVTPDSPAGTEVLDGASSAETLNTGQPAPSQPQPTVPYERFHEVNTGYRHAEARAARAEQAAQLLHDQLQQATQRHQSLEGQLQQRATQVARTPQQEEERQAAIKVLRELQSDDPDHRTLQQLAKAAPALVQALLESRQQITQLREAHALNFSRGEEGRLYQMANAAGLPVATREQFEALNRYVAGIIRAHPEAHQAFVAGDVNIVPWALGLAKQDYDGQRQAARASLAQTKSRMPPPRIGGAQPGSTPIPRYDPKDPRGSMAKIHAGAEAALQAHLGG
jgi:hypothetical protein